MNIDWGGLPEPFEGRSPKVDVINRDNEVLVKAELPGVKKDDVNIQVTENSVTIRATTKHEKTEEKGEYCRRELSSGEFVRSVSLPADVDGAKAKASFKDGLLELTIPKLVESKRHSITIE
jgi:HSP20 family protein